ncbi:MAG: response regulator [Candidatus Poribacteria bacterium]|nr:response regulator [Candidatus Poribacteria bacterium]
MNNHTVEFLLVEDNDDDILLIQESFAELKLANALHVTRDGEEAMAYLRQEGKYKDSQLPGLILLDINMPKKNGFEVLREMKSDARLRHIPVVMLTTSDLDEDVIKSYAEGACSHITKPAGFDEFCEVVKQFVCYWTLIARVPPSRETKGVT